MAELKLRPVREWILARRNLPAEKRGDLIIPAKYREESQIVELLSVGPGRYVGQGLFEPLEFFDGEMVLVAKNAGVEIEVDGEPLTLLRPDEIACKVAEA